MTFDYSLTDIPAIAAKVIGNSSSKTLLFYGEMGSGKTTLIKEIAKQLGVRDITNSPTFSLVNEYHSNKGEVLFHFDFYRIDHEEEAYDIGIEEYFDENTWCFVEWPEKVENLLPLYANVIKLTLNSNNTRTIQIN